MPMPNQQIPEPVASFLDAVNRHDACAFLDAFAPDGEVDDWGRVFSGRAAIKTWSDRHIDPDRSHAARHHSDRRGRLVEHVRQRSQPLRLHSH